MLQSPLNIYSRKLVPFAFVCLLSLAACGGSDSSDVDDSVDNSVDDTSTSVSTDSVLCDYSYDSYNDSASVQAQSTVFWSCSNGFRDVTGNGIPDHGVGTFPSAANPNTISEQSVSASFTSTPEVSDRSTVLGGPAGVIALMINGVKVDAGTGGSCDDTGETCSLGNPSYGWSIEALGQPYFDFGADENNAHVQPDGTYHYHGLPEGLATLRGSNADTMTLIGWAADGFPIYARYGYSDPDDAGSAIVEIQGSYQLVSTVSADRPSTDLYALGAFSQDWTYSEGSGDLDECNGRFGVTPEFPEGIFHYFATDSYPYLQRCVSGVVD